MLIKQTRRDEVTRVSEDSLMQIKRIVAVLSGTPGEPQCHLALILDVLVFTRIQQSLVCTPASFLSFHLDLLSPEKLTHTDSHCVKLLNLSSVLLTSSRDTRLETTAPLKRS